MLNDNKNQNLDDALAELSQNLDMSGENLKKALQSGNLNQIVNKLNPDDASKVKKVLSNQNLISKVMSSPKAQSLLKALMEGNQKGR